MQKNGILQNTFSNERLVSSYRLGIGPSMFEEVLRVSHGLLHAGWKFLNPFTHLRWLMIFASNPLQKLLSGCREGVNGHGVAVAEPQCERGVELTIRGQRFTH